MPTLESRIDDLYKGSPADFIPARDALARTLTGTEARRVRGLPKPLSVPWAVNQVYWHARDVYGRLAKAGQGLRRAQLAALEGRTADVGAATASHRRAIAEAIKAAARLGSQNGVRPDSESLARMFEAVSLQEQPPEPHGRFTKLLQPQGFEALAGVVIKQPSHGRGARNQTSESQPDVPPGSSSAARAQESVRREREEALAAQRRQVAIRNAEEAVTRARVAEDEARDVWTRSKADLEDAERALRDTRRQSG